MVNVAINGFGRIGRAVFKLIRKRTDMQVVAINDLIPADNLAYLLKLDTVYGRYGESVEATDNGLKVGDDLIPVYSVKNPAELPWKDLDVHVAVESTGVFSKRKELEQHITAGAKHVVL